MKTSKETKLSNSTKIDFDLEENISDDQLEEIYGGKKEKKFYCFLWNREQGKENRE
jgi:hypothetical protein